MGVYSNRDFVSLKEEEEAYYFLCLCEYRGKVKDTARRGGQL